MQLKRLTELGKGAHILMGPTKKVKESQCRYINVFFDVR